MYGDVLIDSCWYIRLLRAGHDPLQELALYEDEWDFMTCGVIQVEVLRGLKVRRIHDRMKATFEAMIYVPTHNAIWERAMKVAWELERTGSTMQVTDLVIACCALERDAAVLTFDSDFHRIPGLRVFSQLPRTST